MIMVMVTRTTTGSGTDMTETGMLQLLAWVSPSFPVGAFAYSHGLEAAEEAGLIRGRDSLHAWIDAAIECGSARNDAVVLSAIHKAVEARDWPAVADTADLAASLYGAPELALESLGQGAAFLKTVRAAWPSEGIEAAAGALDPERIAYPVALGIAAAAHGIPREAALAAFFHGFAANAVSAAIRLGIIGQTDGQILTAALEPLIVRKSSDMKEAGIDDLGSASVMIDLLVLAHETQNTRLFRS